MSCTLSLLTDQSREKHFQVSYLSFFSHHIHILLVTTKRIHRPSPFHGKTRHKKDRDHFYHPPCTKDLPAFIIMAVHLQNSAMKTTCIQMNSLGRSRRNSGTANCKLSHSTTDSSVSYFLDRWKTFFFLTVTGLQWIFYPQNPGTFLSRALDQRLRLMTGQPVKTCKHAPVSCWYHNLAKCQ